jgi:hypothetical protein
MNMIRLKCISNMGISCWINRYMCSNENEDDTKEYYRSLILQHEAHIICCCSYIAQMKGQLIGKGGRWVRACGCSFGFRFYELVLSLSLVVGYYAFGNSEEVDGWMCFVWHVVICDAVTLAFFARCSIFDIR